MSVLKRKTTYTAIVKLMMLLGVCTTFLYLWYVHEVNALNISTFSDRLSDSTPLDYSNHTITFNIGTNVSPGGYIDFVPPDGFEIVATSAFSARNVELLVNGIPRSSDETGGVATDTVAITRGSPGLIRYTLNPTEGISENDSLTLLIGSNTSLSYNGGFSYSTSTGTTTYPQDVGIKNAGSAGSHRFTLNVTGGDDPAYANFIVSLTNEVGIGPVDTTETVPPYRYNGAPSGDVGGTTLSVELSVETDEFAVCKYSTDPDISFDDMEDTFESTGLIVHTQIIEGLANNTSYTYYIRCIDDEDNFNVDDYIISFNILDVPEGEPNTEGGNEGDGSGSGDSGSGSSGGGDGSSGEGGSGSDTSGSTSGGGGSGGGGGGTSGSQNSGQSGGGFESSDAPYRSGDGKVIINGYASPRSDVVVLVDGQIAESEKADSDGKFSVTIDEIARGVYTFGIYAVDRNNVRSTTFSTSFSVQGARTSNLSNINLSPTVLVDPDPADIGETVTFVGFSIPNAAITIESENDSTGSVQQFSAIANTNGEWSVEMPTNGFARGTYKVRIKAETENDVETSFSDYTYFGIGQNADVQISADLNGDSRVNLVDFSILLFWWGRSDQTADINQDGTVSLTDFSIMLFNWTG